MVKSRPFESIKAVGFTIAATANVVLRTLGMFGATVVRIESQARPCNLRVAQPYKDGKPGINRSGYYSLYNNDRYSLGLNLKHPKASAVLKRLLEWADVVLENFSPGTMGRLGLSYEQISKINPNIIMLSLSAQGQTGPDYFMPGYGGTISGLSGLNYITGWPDRSPVNINQSYPDFIAPRFASVALLAAIDYRRRTGKGQYIDCSNYEPCVSFLIPEIMDYTVNKRIKVRPGNTCASMAPHGVYKCQGDDKWCAIAVSDEAEWLAFCKVIGNTSLINDPKYKTLTERKINEEELNQLITEWTINYTPEEVMIKMQTSGIAAGVVQNCRDIVNDPQLDHRQYFKTVDHPEMGAHPYLLTNYILSETPAEINKPAPLLGQHTEYVCKELLKMSEEEFVALLLEGTFE
ncbi:CaiB/BaiF CoA transferase family protein [Chloroflexota bacterium]